MTDQIFEYAKKQGWNVGFVIVILWMNSRMNVVEERLFHCYDQLNLSEIKPSERSSRIIITKQSAILPTPIKIEKDNI
jgi:hypothetical protein